MLFTNEEGKFLHASTHYDVSWCRFNSVFDEAYAREILRCDEVAVEAK
jgi:hypothetical protein